MSRWLGAVLLALLSVGCVSAPSATPIVIYVTPSPGPATAQPTVPPTPTRAPSPTPTPTRRPTPSPPNTGFWAIAPVERDPISDKPTTHISLSSSSGRSEFGDPITLVIRCKDGITDIYINWHQFVDTESHPVEWRLGAGSTGSGNWSVSTDYEATFYPGDDVGQVKNFFGATQLVARTTPYGSNTITAEFNITGVENAVVGVRQSCGW